MEHCPSNKYEFLHIPLDYEKSFLEYSLNEIQQYYQWFLDIKLSRLKYLCGFLFSSQESCLNENNLSVIELFLQSSISTILKKEAKIIAERKNMPLHLKPYAKTDEFTFDAKTISICYDISIFLGDLIINLDKKIEWKLEQNSEFADYGQPILFKKGIMLKLNPFRVAKNIAGKIAENTYDEGGLKNIFVTWKNLYKVDDTSK